jgi:hypothetical protein
VRSLQLSCLSLVAGLLLAACAEAPDSAEPVVEPAPPAAVDTADAVPEVDPERLRAFDTALDTLAALVGTLERIEGPIAAWNRAGEAARLLRFLEENRAAFALDLSEAEAARRYPERIGRLNALEARRLAELERIEEDPVVARVLLEEMAKAAARADGPAAGGEGR